MERERERERTIAFVFLSTSLCSLCSGSLHWHEHRAHPQGVEGSNRNCTLPSLGYLSNSPVFSFNHTAAWHGNCLDKWVKCAECLCRQAGDVRTWHFEQDRAERVWEKETMRSDWLIVVSIAAIEFAAIIHPHSHTFAPNTVNTPKNNLAYASGYVLTQWTYKRPIQPPTFSFFSSLLIINHSLIHPFSHRSLLCSLLLSLYRKLLPTHTLSALCISTFAPTPLHPLAHRYLTLSYCAWWVYFLLSLPFRNHKFSFLIFWLRSVPKTQICVSPTVNIHPSCTPWPRLSRLVFPFRLFSRPCLSFSLPRRPRNKSGLLFTAITHPRTHSRTNTQTHHPHTHAHHQLFFAHHWTPDHCWQPKQK